MSEKVFPFTSPYKHGSETRYVISEDHFDSWTRIRTLEKTCYVTYMGKSYIDNGNESPPKALIKMNGEVKRVSFNKLKP